MIILNNLVGYSTNYKLLENEKFCIEYRNNNNIEYKNLNSKIYINEY
jgi:hypothetical protein